ncbi:Protein terminal ear1 [Carex littledalei]|uniref:Protein terminal ear1 n=1 Tax=Carex littledalei TaxID=544730 RepID=A0A833RD27_9POAL|nr:Protein terminal ear1 [Carex littledalei]
MLDQHCAEQQKRHEEKKFVISEYDFVYLPIDFSTRANKGYAFVNFTTVEAANNANKEIHRRKWVIFNSKKVARVCYARVQGKTALVNRFSCSQFRCDTDEFLPATFTPPRNGTTSRPPPDTVGKRIINSLPLKHSR